VGKEVEDQVGDVDVLGREPENVEFEGLGALSRTPVCPRWVTRLTM
jgi:hypothetical protein